MRANHSNLIRALFYAALISFAAFGAGALIWPRRGLDQARFSELVMIGMVPFAVAAMVLHFFFPIGEGARWAALGIALVSGIFHLFRMRIRWTDAAWFALSLVYFVKESLVSAIPFDTGLYHLQNLKWMEAGRIVPGFANVHSRLAFDSLSLIAAEMFHFGADWTGPMLLNSVFISAACAFLLSYVFHAHEDRKLVSISYAGVAALFLLAGRRFFEIGSLSTDVVANVVILVMIFWAIRVFEGAPARWYLLILPVLAIETKLSAAVAAAGCAAVYWKTARPIRAAPCRAPRVLRSSGWLAMRSSRDFWRFPSASPT